MTASGLPVAGSQTAVLIGEERFDVEPGRPFVFGRRDDGDTVGLDPEDMGISAEAGSIEQDFGLWWVVNRSSKRRLLLELEPGLPPLRLACGDRHAITHTPLVVLVTGAVYTHRLEVHIPTGALAPLRTASPVTSGTVTHADLGLSDRDRQVLTALCAGYLRPFPRRDPRPAEYGEIAEILGGDWTPLRVRKQLERLKQRLTRRSLFFDGPRANEQLAVFLIDSGNISAADLEHLDGPR